MKFNIGDRVRKVENGEYFRVVLTPDTTRLESGEKAYAYKPFNRVDDREVVTVISQSEMEDGRFEYEQYNPLPM